ncbi:MAG: glutamine-hydrolyzing carbamoyl-phosphate synthase small subunit [Spirochaetes bacterium]|nr:glutamine-hydrolyzing carbamoyl-phosphate synthase small subunit [Spirochaetota bacterium]
MQKKAFLILEDGFTLEGLSFGYEGETMGEVVFNTSMSGYQEILTDPSYTGQIVTLTYPMIGNYGINSEDIESDKIQVAGFVVKEYSRKYSNHRATSSLADYLIKNKIPAIEGIDTRKLTTYIRDKGALRGGIFFTQNDSISKLKNFPEMTGLDLATGVSAAEPYVFHNDPQNKYSVAVVDFGVKTNILRMLKEQGLNVKVFPAQTPFNEIIADKIDGIFLSNGPGDPAAVEYAPELVRKISESKIPCFGICLGHQLLSIGLSTDTYKLKFGHRGGNQPVKNLSTGSVEITSQNHGFSVDQKSLSGNKDIEVTHINLNDNTVEGIKHKTLPIFSVQYHPEASPGPNDSKYLFRQFYELIEKNSKKSA